MTEKSLLTIQIPALEDETEDDVLLVERLMLTVIAALDDGIELDDIRHAFWRVSEGLHSIKTETIQ